MIAMPWPLQRLQVLCLLALGFQRRALRQLDTRLRRRPDDAWALASRSVLWHRLGQGAAALADAQSLVRQHPHRAGADWFNLGFLLQESGQLESALAAFHRACELSPRLDTAWYGQGLTACMLGQWAQAEAAWRRCAELQPLAPHAWYQLARLYADLGRHAESARVREHLQGFEPAVAAQLQHELAPLAQGA